MEIVLARRSPEEKLYRMIVHHCLVCAWCGGALDDDKKKAEEYQSNSKFKTVLPITGSENFLKVFHLRQVLYFTYGNVTGDVSQ